MLFSLRVETTSSDFIYINNVNANLCTSTVCNDVLMCLLITLRTVISELLELNVQIANRTFD